MTVSPEQMPFYVEQFSGIKLPTHTGSIMPSLVDPDTVPVSAASFMRENDCVLGIIYKDIKRAYPLWVMDNYHIANDCFGEDPILIVHCERCSSGVAYDPVVNGQRLVFQVAGIWKMTLMIRDEQTNSIWAHNEGRAVDGPLEGVALPRYPCYQTTWTEWIHRFPDAEVIVWPEDNVLHHDGRHGHGSRDYLGRPGIRAGHSLGVIPDRVDERLPENCLVLGLRVRDGSGKAYPLEEVHKNGGVVNDILNDEGITIWSPQFDDHMIVAFSSKIDGIGKLTFSCSDKAIIDEQTESVWSLDGIALKGELKGHKLNPADWALLKWHAWCPFHPEAELYRSDKQPDAECMQTSAFDAIFDTLQDASYEITYGKRILKALLPNLAGTGISVAVNRDPLIFYKFTDSLGAAEYVYGDTHSFQFGQFVVKSDPDRIFADNAQLERLPDDKIAWSQLIDDSNFIDCLNEAILWEEDREGREKKGLHHLFYLLINKGYQINIVQQLETHRLYPQCQNGFEILLNDDPFMSYRFDNPVIAADFTTKYGYTITAGTFVFRSDPVDQYKHLGLRTTNAKDEEVSWSLLLNDENLIAIVQDFVEA